MIDSEKEYGKMIDIVGSMKRCKRLQTIQKDATDDRDEKNHLGKSLNLLDLVGLGIGSTIGIGIYLLTGRVAKNLAGPAVILSFLIAAVASSLAGICFAEFGSRAPTAGSVYTFCYVTLGEFGAFAMGWNLITEYVIGAASVAKALSVYIDAFFGYPLKTIFCQIYQVHYPFISEYFDFFSLFICLGFSVALAVGLKESVFLNNIVTGLNLLVVTFVTVYGSTFSNFNNWMLQVDNIPQSAGNGGFLPYGLEGVIKGAGACFYGFIGFDCIATTGEEVKNPQKVLPLAIIISLSVVFLAYLSISSVLTLMLPYYLQDELAPISYAFEINGCHWAKWLIYVGSFLGLYASFFGALYPISRITYTMANDGLLFKFFGKVHKKYKTPFSGTIFSGLITGVIAAAFDVEQLINLNAIGTLLSYTMVAACVIILRYSDNTEETPLLDVNCGKSSSFLDTLKRVFNCGSYAVSSASQTTNSIVTIKVLVFCILSTVFCILLMSGTPFKVPLSLVLLCLMIQQLISIQTQSESQDAIPFKVPLVPYLPAISILINIYLMVAFDFYTWIRLIIWMLMGTIIYFAYGIFHSTERFKVRSCP